ncbi:MAG: tripartite tricarboxylate transporter permease [Firmicutes bacterium]|nr:tripartite tricarboxylate transporter permease [Bacillota bacterium]
MDWHAILDGFAVALQFHNVVNLFIGVFLGTVIGVLPGIGPATGVALLIPLTFGMDPTSSLIMMAGVYYGAMYGGSTSAILINTPGDASAIMTTIDGHKMALKGRGGAALAIAAIGSFFAGTVCTLLLTVLAQPLANLALKFGPAEYFALMVFALSAVTSLSGASLAKGLMATAFGLMLSTVGMDLQTGVQRFTFGSPALMDGIDFLVVVVGLFAVSEVLLNMERVAKGELRQPLKSGRVWLTREEWRQAWPAILRATPIGFLVGALPGAGGTVASILSYTVEKRISKTPERFGEGAIEGVAGPETANNASSVGAMIPLLSLGVPGSGTTAVMLGALMMFGLRPGPLLFHEQPHLVWGLIDSMYLGNLILLILNLPLVGIFVKLLEVPMKILNPVILALAFIGIYSINYSVSDLFLVAIFGVLGYLMKKVDVPTAPMVLALILGYTMEQSFRQALQASRGSLAIFVSSPIAVALLLLAAAAVIIPIVTARRTGTVVVEEAES